MLVGATLALPTLLAAGELDRLERAELHTRNARTADHVASRFEQRLKHRVAAVARFARELESAPESVDPAARARPLLEEIPELQELTGLDPEGRARWVVRPEAGGDNHPQPDAPSSALKPAMRVNQGGRPAELDRARGALWVRVPGGRAPAALEARFLVDALIALAVPPELSSEVAVELLEEHEATTAGGWSSERAIGVLGQAFILTVVPSPEALAGTGLVSRGLAGLALALGLLVVLITHEMQRNRALALEEERRRAALLAAVPDHLVRLGRDLEVLAYHRAPQLTPLPLDRLASDWMPARLRACVERAALERRIVETDAFIAERAYEVRIVPDPEGRLVLHLRDVTDRREMEAERILLARLVASSSQLAAVVGADGLLEYVNPTGQAMLGLEEGGSLFLDAFVRPAPEIFSPLGGKPAWSGRVDLTSRTGEIIPAHLTAFAVMTSRGPKLGLLALDLRETVELERQLRQAHKMEALGTLAAGVAHDFNNALSVFRTGLELLETTPELPAEALEDVALMRSAVGSAAHVAGQLLAFSRPGPLRQERFTVDEVVAGSARMLSRVVREDIELGWRLDAPSIEVLGDPGALQQVVVNLVLNARDAISGKGNITLATSVVVDEGRRRVTVSVEDDGAGIPEALRGRIFEPFFTTKEGGGSGLGLAMVKRVVEQLGGEVRLESEVGKGTKVSLHLPALSPRARPGSAFVPTGSVCQKARVVIADDDAALRHLLRRALERAGHEVDVASDGLEALRLLAEPTDVLVTDLVMPRMGGLELTRRARREWPGLHIMLVSGHLDVVSDALDAGVTLVPKPLDAAMLLQQIESTLRSPFSKTNSSDKERSLAV